MKMVKYSYTFDSKVFNTKTSAKKFISSYLKNGIVRDNDKKWLVEDLFSMHPCAAEKLKDYASIEIHKIGRSNAFHIKKTTGKLIDISYLKCFDGRNNKKELSQVMRYSICSQIYNFRNTVFLDDNVLCELCKINIYDNEETHIDHVIMFKDLVKNFMKRYDLTDITRSKIVDEYGNERWEISDVDIENNWMIYHDKNSVLRAVCKKCNLTRTK